MAGASGTSAPKAEKAGWHALFDGATLTGWKAAEHPDAWTVKDGTLACNGERSHLFYVGPVADAQFADFEAEFEVLHPHRRQLRCLFPHRLGGQAAGRRSRASRCR